MKVIIDNGGVRSHIVNDKAQISHEIEKKTSLDKKRGGALEKRQERTIGDTAKANTTRGSPSAAQQKATHFSKQTSRGTEAKSETHHKVSSKSAHAKPSGSMLQEQSRTVGKLDKSAIDKKTFAFPRSNGTTQEKIQEQTVKVRAAEEIQGA